MHHAPALRTLTPWSTGEWQGSLCVLQVVPHHYLPSNNSRDATKMDELFSAAAFRLAGDPPTLGKQEKSTGTREQNAL